MIMINFTNEYETRYFTLIFLYLYIKRVNYIPFISNRLSICINTQIAYIFYKNANSFIDTLVF